jgi:hypothetical protein
MKNRGGEENCKAAANKLRKIQRALAETIPLSPRRAHATRPSNASFETKHHPPAAFPGSLSFTEGRRTHAILPEKSRENPLFSAETRSYSRLAVEVRQSVLGEKLVLAASVLDGQRNLGFLEARLA